MKKIKAERRFEATKLMVLQKNSAPQFSAISHLEEFLRPQDLLVMNLSGTIPGSFWVSNFSSGQNFEIRLASFAGNSLTNLHEWWAISFGAGDWQNPTENRGRAPTVKKGEFLTIDAINLKMEILFVDPKNPRLFKLAFVGDDFLSKLYKAAAPIQYSHQESKLALWDVQSPLAQIPLSVEAPSALFPFSWQKLLELKKNHRLAFLYHGAGISSTGDPKLDARLPLPEFFSIPRTTVEAWRETRSAGGRVIAVGTSVARALESAKEISDGPPSKIDGITTLRVDPGFMMERVDGMLTGYHDPLTSHFDLEAAFVGAQELSEAFRGAERLGFQKHEFGDATLLFGA